MVQARLLLGLALSSLFASVTLAIPIADNGAAVERREIPKGFTCGCLTECMIACPDIRLCLCPPQPCIEKYLCKTTTKPIPTKTIKTKTSTTKKPSKTTIPPPTKTTYIPPGFTCGCLTQCEIDCGPNLAACTCPSPQVCLRQYLCTKTTVIPTPTPEPLPEVPCGCTNGCKIACPTCICPQYCDPKYECP